ncbi:Amino acid permease-associated region [Pseudonocardia sp. Ae168_Ps1]|uniref:APC family permease n=1 Tax=unclassified Pseudonocardia TaxID=2619320 RepID=UPI00094AC843|nr:MULTISPECIES: APC family permease [unclassified Pseudonocardia]OLL76516.1 Amino acid permease-associated region [Pseudonocardia sp. Ae150A_Ps1]OLL82526.1 Amino acid permease-associated region [Pseudonocardia sp. Ae168_Ps1]OLL83360.1 Amino acid permease-associated region [Pseudonocardia sp. Ae263_Ps1]OLL90602.1 Amino acid permease-associated region [Pseudonocardia sp. Ae356_Ps1]
MADATTTEAQPALKRVMGPKLLLLFIVGDILGTGIYALVGEVAQEVGGAAWLPFLVAFAVAMVTAFSYLELVTKYPAAAGAALYAHKAFGIHFLTFMVTFVVMCSGITSASTASRAFASNLNEGFGLDLGNGGIVLIALGFMALVAAVNFRGVGESVKVNVVLTLVELSGLLLVILVGVFAIAGGNADWARVIAFDTPEDKGVFLAVTSATSLAFFAMVGFEDSVNMAEECHEPRRIFPKIMITGLTITGIIYVLVAICAVALVPVGPLAASETPLVEVVRAGAPGIPADAVLPFISMFAVANSALINMLMASRLLYGMANQAVLPKPLARVHPFRRTPWVAIVFTTLISFGLITYVSLDDSSDVVSALGGTTSLLLLAVFTIVNIAVLVLRRDTVDADHFRAPPGLPVVGAITSLYLVLPFSGRDTIQYELAGLLLLLGLVLYGITVLLNRRLGVKRATLDPAKLDG